MDTTSNQLPTYKSHKTVRAAKIRRLVLQPAGGHLLVPEGLRYQPFTVSDSYVQKHNPQLGGYYVLYENGHESYSPAKPFEEGYTLVEGHRPNETVETPVPDYQQRVIAEKRELDGKLAALVNFFDTQIFKVLPDAERSRLRNQARFMDGYASILGERIEAFTKVQS